MKGLGSLWGIGNKKEHSHYLEQLWLAMFRACKQANSAVGAPMPSTPSLRIPRMTKDQLLSSYQKQPLFTPRTCTTAPNQSVAPCGFAGPPYGRVPGRLREGSRLYSYLRRGDITALKPHNLLPHPAASTFWRRPSRSPPTLATGHQSHRAQGGVGEGKWRQRLSKKDLCPPDRSIDPEASGV